jgi:hypothetical protein
LSSARFTRADAPPNWELRFAGSALLGMLAAAVLGIVLRGSLQYENMADFHVMRDAARGLLQGHSGNFVYPPPAAFPLIPLGFIPYKAAAVIWLAVLLASVPATLLVLGVRDWRCHAATLLSASTLAVFGAGSLSSLLTLGVALLWKHRDRRVAPIVIAACVVVAKIYLWPLLPWLWATGRRRTAGTALLATVAVAFAGWAATGFAGLTHYPQRLSSVAGLEQGQGYSVVALGLALGLKMAFARALAVGAGLALLVGMFVVARRPEGERRSLALAVLATLVLTPVSWLHYFILLTVPIALMRPRFAPLWLAPLGFWLTPMRSGGELRLIVTAAVLYTGIALVPAFSSSRPPAQAAAGVRGA